MSFDDMMASLEKEILATQSDEEQKESLARLEEMAKTYDGDDRVVPAEELFEIVKNQPEKKKYFTGLELLDEKMEGFVTGESIFVSGITKHGKTSMCMEISHRLTEMKPLWLSFEEKAIDLLRKFNERSGEMPNIFTPLRNEKTDLDWIEKKIIEAKAKYDCKAVFIDHIGFISDAERGKDDTEASRLERISRSIHSLAVKWDVLIFLLGHLTKVSSTQNPDIENIKGSSAMAQEADLTMLVWRKTKRNNGVVEISNETNLSLQANRRGKTGNIGYIYEKGRFTEWVPEPEEETKSTDTWIPKSYKRA